LYQEVLRTRQPRSFENEYQLEGKNFSFEISAYPSETGLSVFVKDITERKQMEEALRDSEARYRLLAENTSDLIWIMDMGLRYTYMSPSVTRMRGYTVEELVGASITETMTAASIEAARKTLAEELAMERMEQKDIHRSRKLELEMYCKDGSTIWTEMNMTFLRDSDGKPVGIQGTTRDITERKRAEEALRQVNQRLTIVHQIDRAILAARSQQTIARVVLRHIRELIPCRGAAIVRFDFERGEARLVASNLAGQSGWPHKRRFSLEGLNEVVAGLRRGKAFRIEDVLALPQLPPAIQEARAAGIRSMLNLPLITQAGLVGVLSLSADAPSAFTAEHEEMARQLAASLAIGIQQADLSDQLRGRLSELETVHRAGRRLQQLHMPEALAETVSEVIRESVRHDYADLLLVDQPSGRLVPFVSSERAAITAIAAAAKAYQLARASHPTASITGWVARSGQSLRLGDVREDERYVPLHGRVRSELCVPLRAGDEIIGVINLEARRLGAYTEADQRLLETVAVPIAVAIQDARLYEQVSAGRQRLRALSQRLLTAQEAERKRIAGELHDEVGQALTAVILNLQAVQRKLDSSMATLLHECISVVQSALQQVRSLSLDLRPAVLDDLGLVQAIQWYINRQSQRAGFAATFKADPPELQSPPEVAIVCYRVVQEALTNVVRHAHARRVGVELRQCQAELELVIRDDGVGFDVTRALQQAATGTSLGLLGLQERVTLLGGQVEMTSTPGSGTQVRVRIPWRSAADSTGRAREGEP
jgi:PAS domain S-box-containing protein